jgi:23S rRNA pseudouridine2605 synthase
VQGTRKMGLARALSKMGICSRSKASAMIQAGRVRLNGAVKRDPETAVVLGRDHIDVDGRPGVAATRAYLMLNKPRGALTTAADEMGRRTVYDFLQQATDSTQVPPGFPTQNLAKNTGQPWLAPVGRLDKASEGLLLFTNDSEWSARVLAPETHLDKTYHVQIGHVAGDHLLASLRQGVESDGEILCVKSVERLRSGEKNSWLEVVLDEGKNRHIRRMLDTLRIEVLRLIRVAIGPLQLGDLAKGSSRPLTTAEKDCLDQTLNRSAKRRVR